MAYARYVALGDSRTGGWGEGAEGGGYGGWPDRLAEQLAAVNPDLRYANLAVRGRLAAQVRAGQLGPALELRPDLATVMAGMNDLIRPGFNAAVVTGHLEEMLTALTAAAHDSTAAARHHHGEPAAAALSACCRSACKASTALHRPAVTAPRRAGAIRGHRPARDLRRGRDRAAASLITTPVNTQPDDLGSRIRPPRTAVSRK